MLQIVNSWTQALRRRGGPSSSMDDERLRSAIGFVRALGARRIESHPDSPFFAFGERELRRIENAPSIDRAFYRSLNIGLMCARELEGVDPEYCDAVYAMLECVRKIAKG